MKEPSVCASLFVNSIVDGIVNSIHAFAAFALENRYANSGSPC